MLQVVRPRWWQKRLHHSSNRSARPGSQPLRSFWLLVEGLEDRTLLNAGMLDPTFGTGGQVTTPIANGTGATGLVLQPDGKLVAGGSAGTNLVIERYNPDGSADSTFGTGGQVNANVGPSGVVRLALQTDGKILASGSSGDLVSNNLQMVVARFLPNGVWIRRSAMMAGQGWGRVCKPRRWRSRRMAKLSLPA